MAAFSYQNQPFLLDCAFLQNFPRKMSGFSAEPNTNTPCFSQFYQPHLPLQDISLDASVHDSSCLENSTAKLSPSNNETSVTNKHTTDSSSAVLDKLESGDQVTQNLIPMDNKRKYKDGSSMHSAQSKDTREVKSKKQKKSNGGMKNVTEDKPKVYKKNQKRVCEEDPSSYIHVRARRGQATDSHSLAERVRREKISERMKLLQSLVPGCDKVTGKALMLDEIINYVQSLQNQVEFLSMKLASVNPMLYDFGMDLEALMFKPERMSNLGSPQLNVQKCNLSQLTAFSDAINSFTTANNYPLMESSLLFQQGQMPNILSQNNGQVLWDKDGQRQKLINQCGFTNLGSFH